MTDLIQHDSTLAEEMRYAQAIAVQPERGAAQSLLPQAYRGNPANVLIAVGLGKAIGIAPAQALYDIYVVNGRPSPSANLMAALVRRAGHKIRIKGDAASCTATLIRSDDPDEPFEATWTIEQARAAGLASKDTWKAYPAAMLRSRAIAEVVRMGASECVLGMDYSAEEMRDVEATRAPAVSLGSFQPAPKAEPGAVVEQAADEETVEATIEPDETGEALTKRTQGRIFAQLQELWPAADDDQQRALFAWAAGVESLESRKDITEAMGLRIEQRFDDEKKRRQNAPQNAGAES